MTLPQVSLVIPIFNEADLLPELEKRLCALMEAQELSIEVVLVDDGSRDSSGPFIRQLAMRDKRFTGVFLARNYGHQTALTAGLAAARGTEGVMVLDGDLQDPPEMLGQFYAAFQQGSDVVYGIRKNRKEGPLKRFAYNFFYRLLKRIAYIDIPLDSGDFAFLSRRVVDILNQMPEESRYIRGMRSWVGFEQTGIEYNRDERASGKSKFTFGKLFKLAYNGIFNFSEFPIKFITNLGIVTIVVALTYLAYNIVKRFIISPDEVPEGFTGLLFTIVLFSGVQLISLGVIGEYVLRIFFQVKERPLFIVRDKIVDQQQESPTPTPPDSNK